LSNALRRAGGFWTTSTRQSITAGIAAVLGVGLSVASISVATASRAHAAPGAAARASNIDTGFAGPVQESATWSGYVVAPRTARTNVAASWKVPAVVCRKTTVPEAAVFWVGLDGWYDKTVEQAGVEAYCSGTTPVYTAWWEMLPSNHITQVFSVRPGDQISASVAYRSGVFTITVKDLTLRRTSTVKARCAPTTCNSSAEWIAESPTYGAQSAYLPRWSPMTFTGALSSALVDQRSVAISGFANFAVVMTGLDGRHAQPGSLLSRGSAFTESWLASN
jgi:Peptidase A4 family